jgi:hypothetical protein
MKCGLLFEPSSEVNADVPGWLPFLLLLTVFVLFTRTWTLCLQVLICMVKAFRIERPVSYDNSHGPC